MADDLKRDALWQAAQRVSPAELALWLGVSVPLVKAWLVGIAAMPERQYRLVVDLLGKLGDARSNGTRSTRVGNVYELRPRQRSKGVRTA